MKKLFILLAMVILLVGCAEIPTSASEKDTDKTIEIGDKLSESQPTPTDINYSLERYNLIKRTYWVNGQRDKANALQSKVPLPLGYIVLFSGPTVVSQFSVEGKVSSLNSFLTPDSEYYELNYGGTYTRQNAWLPDVDGSYGENDNGIFFFTADGKYVEWTGDYIYSDLPIFVENPVISVGQ